MELEIGIEGAAALKERLGKLAKPALMARMNKTIGRSVLEHVKDHLSTMSASRHKTADRLGARHTRFLEYAAGRTRMTSADAVGATIEIQNTPGLSRAFRDLTITPAGGKKFLTLPLHRIAYGKRVADLRGNGHKVFRPGKARILAEMTGKGKKAKLRPLYALVKSVRIPKDEGLLPSEKMLRRWTTDAAEGFVEAAEELLA